MSYLTHRLAPPLDRYIECLWHAEMRVTYAREKILPSGTVELIINFGAPFLLARQAQPQLQTESWLVGLQTSYLINEPMAETHMIGGRGGRVLLPKVPLGDAQSGGFIAWIADTEGNRVALYARQ